MQDAQAAIRIVYAGAPKGKGRPRFSRQGDKIRTFTPAATRSYEDGLRYAAQEAMAGRAPMDGPLAVQFVAHMPIPKSWPRKRIAAALAGEIRPTGKPDLDNLLKTSDGLNEIVWRDDAQIVEATVAKVYSDRPRLEILVEPFAAWASIV